MGRFEPPGVRISFSESEGSGTDTCFPFRFPESISCEALGSFSLDLPLAFRFDGVIDASSADEPSDEFMSTAILVIVLFFLEFDGGGSMGLKFWVLCLVWRGRIGLGSSSWRVSAKH